MSAIDKRYDFVFLFDVANGNPNGDPDAGNLPRIDPETSRGLVTDVCLKRKIRNYVELAKDNAAPFEIYVKEKAILTNQQKRAHEDLPEDLKDGEKTAQAKAWMCQNFFDVRTFGAVMSLKDYNCGQVRGPVQLTFARSEDPIAPMDISITRMAVATQAEADKQHGDNRTMGRKAIVPYGLYRCHGFVSAPLAERTGFGADDLALLWEALQNMFEHDHSAARGEMASRGLYVFEHENKMGNAPAHTLFSLVNIARTNGDGAPPRSFEDYAVTVDEANMPQGVTLHSMI
ncbi:type I-C CRISPR-associated protein Cas7/Csd2 [Oceanidesulfovibrio marinus]|uniref:Type I-C CRISPR-associated protein Cas7/Csd2 n=1 Tax=Oceanidesulfovibrio marinus TaxID=370038 RepID=A0A6P1ZB92_9BACT|nr:type I-C CRISPR-associated protein Cas7/Csd2 [Oceanidesulfovibrio marinus]TVM30250.1 type I-C CRISPR-associated protein Cas7/Csd2 [Oceanidesulfovibrio marinus]